MSTNPHRRRLLGLFAAAPLAAAAGVTPTANMRRARMLTASLRVDDHASATLGRLVEQLRGPGIPGIGAAIERAHPLDPATPATLVELVENLRTDPGNALTQQAAEARMIAALVVNFPPEIAAYRSFGAPMRRRLYVELLTRESARLAATSEPPPMPPASLGPDA